jgi:putative Mg2+ transporter-C (MgtC) family protein
MDGLPITELALRLGAATLCGALVGFDREVRHKPAGIRTLALVALGAALMTLAVMAFTDRGNATRGIQGVITGVGFLGAGVILRTQDGSGVTGITTAASIWLVAGLGVACALGQWPLVAVTGVMVVLVFTIGDRIEGWLHHRTDRRRAARDPAQG